MNSASATSRDAPAQIVSTASARVFGRIDRSVGIHVLQQEPLLFRGSSADLNSWRRPHENSAPRARIIGMKSGKLVAMKAVSSTLTGLSAAQPITSADIAMR